MQEQQVQKAYEVRPVAEIVHQFLQELETHPDAQIASCAIAGPCPAGLMLPNTPRHLQHLTELRLVYRDPMASAEAKTNKPWKWQSVVDASNQEQPIPKAEAPNPRWAAAISPTKAQVEESAIMRQLEAETVGAK